MDINKNKKNKKMQTSNNFKMSICEQEKMRLKPVFKGVKLNCLQS
jgi:hypothetical protein